MFASFASRPLFSSSSSLLRVLRRPEVLEGGDLGCSSSAACVRLVSSSLVLTRVPACLEQFPMATDETAVADRVGGVDHRRTDHPLDPRDMDLSGEEHVPKARKPYTITKQREKWTEDEHRRFLEALQLHGRAWRRIQEHIGTKTAVQIRSHAQKFFTKVVRESSSGSNASAGGAAPAIQIPPPRPKRKPAHPYPRKVDGGAAAKKPAPELKQLEKPPPTPLRDQDEEGSPTSVLTSAHTVLRGAEVFGNSSSASRSPALSSAAGSDERGDGGGSLGSSVDGEDACASPARTGAPYTTKVLDDASQGGSEAPILKLFGKKVVVEDLRTDSSSPASAVQATGNENPIGDAGASTWNPWPGSVQVQQLMYLVPQPDGFAAAQPVMPWFGYNGSLPCAVFYPQPQAAVASAPEHQQHQQQQASEPLDHRRAQREGSLTGSNMAASSAAGPPAASAAQNSDTAESHHGGAGQENTSDGYAALRRSAAVPRLTKCASSASFSGRGFVPYKRCAAESQAPRPVPAPGEEADGELTRLCL